MQWRSTATGTLPRCPACGALARPNVLMFGDSPWVSEVTHAQQQRYQQWLAAVLGKRVVIVELGAGKAIATIRRLGERVAAERDRATLVRPGGGDPADGARGTSGAVDRC